MMRKLLNCSEPQCPHFFLVSDPSLPSMSLFFKGAQKEYLFHRAVRFKWDCKWLSAWLITNTSYRNASVTVSISCNFLSNALIFFNNQKKWWRVMWWWYGNPRKNLGMSPVEVLEAESPTRNDSCFLTTGANSTPNFLGPLGSLSSLNLPWAFSWQTEDQMWPGRKGPREETVSVSFAVNASTDRAIYLHWA